MKMKILFLLQMNQTEQEIIIKQHQQCHFIFKKKTALTQVEIESADVIIGNPPINLLNSKLRKLKWLQLSSAGFNEYLAANVLPAQTLLSNARGAFGLTVAEHAIALILALMRKLDLYFNNQGKHLWQGEGSIKSIYGAKIGVVGLGNIGNTLAEKLQLLGAEVIGIDNQHRQNPSFFSKIYQQKDLKTAFAELDVLVLCLPSTADNYHFINQETLSYLKSDAFLINVSRGSLVNARALKKALDNQLLAGAALDVFEEEPLPADDPLWETERLIITPHAAGGFTLPATKVFALKIINKNIELFMNDKKLINLINR
ncbi:MULTISPECIES: D-2-hydroxyacid dehydrogenase [unclassified Enterococcus]|uniref:D-2-hydroxyacid dehydrogenase n=1 Tax=unclassified Enterococcus TaxID=2608891 RepID=UPI001552850C|nr:MULTISPECIES: D-2-hydroxyacid dehydrogenase [unclassified Enterococcus]MBS7576727.1 D-2-hydroxyacid dehydrogenase [Enterococcus sp. MMGLQ5-2]MBS7583786.1 D-2-hydroxyacid dehydrogenase [Enterococcus sp. MMGLQ5-1]NPD11647.1 D-2-hydroxyacid dehydrogenase [Enterococcus sp. MMGLQ5-1]NPD36564.1 D-2-hydroxyacid dehydrogenase [Enterococcus sp. MMGLQ5-2]